MGNLNKSLPPKPFSPKTGFNKGPTAPRPMTRGGGSVGPSHAGKRFLQGGGLGALGVVRQGSAEHPYKCIECQRDVQPGVSGPDAAYMKPGGVGPYCVDCWKEGVIVHPFGMRQGAPDCHMPIRFDDNEVAQMQRVVASVVGPFVQQYRQYPPAKLIDDAFARHIRWSKRCNFCKADVVFSPESSDIRIPGVNAPVAQQPMQGMQPQHVHR